MDEDVFETRRARLDADADLVGERRERGLEPLDVGPHDMERRAERRDLLNAVERGDARYQTGEAGARTTKVERPEPRTTSSTVPVASILP